MASENDVQLLENLQLRYTLILQTVNAANQILSTIEKLPCISLPNSITGENVIPIDDGAADQPLNIITGVTDFVLLHSDREITFKLNSVVSAPIFLRTGGVALLDSKNISDVLISNVSGERATVLFVQAKSQALA